MERRRQITLATALGLVALGASACGGSGDEGGVDGDDGAGVGIECGESTCSGSQFCLVLQSGPFMASEPEESTCTAAPAGCDVSRLCDCDIEELDGLPVTGCSILGGRDLHVTDTRCGAMSCGAGEGCVMVGNPLGSASQQRCEALPAGCEVSPEFCETDCTQRLAERLGEEPNGCMAADWAVGIYLKE